MAESFNVVIPARYQSTRLPGKPLADIHGQPMIVRVAERASRAGAQRVIVATDDERICQAVTDAGYVAMMTRADHGSGSDRVMEVAVACGWRDDTIVINVQGDEPLIPPSVIRQVAHCLSADPELPAATLCEPLDDRQSVLDPNVVKVVRGHNGLALYFSRAPVPHDRDGIAVTHADTWLRHVGIYGYRLATLRKFVGFAPSRLEMIERLEQLRLLENGIRLYVADACETVPAGVDTPADLERIRLHLQRMDE
ncbi:MAG: 3-deoxy-manno-octulosonate cytidylyltransferase [Gammaproteobacteria bacterium]|nr:3-deoxy-manno-octulosonate cytidylyltransferase [Gammaproteobacteria bacterium]